MKILTAETCPDCKHKFESSHEMEGVEPIRNEGKIKEIKSSQQILEEPKEVIKEVIKIEKVAPSDSPFYTCSDGNCEMDGLHKNKNYTKRPKEKCKNCESLNGSKKCKNCGNKDENEFETLEADELDDLGIPEPLEKEHTHED